jgi:formylglycine-generating enzyme required for sulfatase activity/energy-coupling factor transporter ATP-binding protein EcfA2
MNDTTINRSGGTDINANNDVNIGGDVTGRDKITIIINAMGSFTPPPNLEQLRRDYLDHVRRAYRALDFKGIPQLETLSRELPLEEVYVPLVARPELPKGETWERRLAGRKMSEEMVEAEFISAHSAQAAPVRVEEALRDQTRIVIIGDPGSGKSTLLKHLVLRLAAEDNAPLPILVPLNAYADVLLKSEVNLQQYLPAYFAGIAKGMDNLGPLFDEAIRQGRAVILLDGLDEVQRDRANLVQKVEAFAHEAIGQGNKIVVTSRVVGYRESPLNPKDWTLYTLLDFDRAAIEDFARKWCTAFEKSTKGDTSEALADAEKERVSLIEALDANPGVANLASNPLLLTILALIKRQGVSLPNHRVELYELYLKTLISAWSKARALDKKPVGPPLDYLETVSVLGPLALSLREENPTYGLISEERLIDWLTHHFMGEDWGLRRGEARTRAREFLDSVHKYSNLLLERGQGRYGFIHLTFEEALAARGLVQRSQLKLEDSLAVIRGYIADAAWRETILLAVGVWGLVREEPRKAGEVVRAILKMDCAGDDACTNILLAGNCLEDVGEMGLSRAVAHEVKDALLAACHNRSLLPTVQRDAGFILGRVGWIPDDLDAFITIPAGPFIYQDRQKVKIDKPYQIGKYPVTNLQYRRFVDAEGYAKREYWSDDGWAWRTGTYDSKATEDYEKNWLAERPKEKRGEPYFWHDLKWNNPLAPVVGVSWFEAEAYCNWLAQELGKPTRLPTEEEWERAARHTDGREYPWGEKFDRDRLNCAEFWGGKNDLDWNQWFDSKGYEVASTTMVGQFEAGNSMAGASDMSGNVWEWTNSWYDEEHTRRSVRGGSWFNNRNDVRCAYRVGFIPNYFDDFVGFRVFSPGSISGF